MYIKQTFDKTNAKGRCIKKVITVLHEERIYTVVCDKQREKWIETSKQLRIYWNENTGSESGWGQNYLIKISEPSVHNNIPDSALDVGNFALTLLGDVLA